MGIQLVPKSVTLIWPWMA